MVRGEQFINNQCIINHTSPCFLFYFLYKKKCNKSTTQCMTTSITIKSIYSNLFSPSLSYCDKAKNEWQLLSVGPNPIVTPPEQRAISHLLCSRRQFCLWLDRTDFRHTVRQATSDWCWVVWHQKHVETDRHGDQDNEVQFRYVSVEAKMKDTRLCLMPVLK